MNIIHAPAKINLTLNITGKQGSFHLLKSLVAFGIIEDRIKIFQSNQWKVNTEGKFAALINDVNIVEKIIRLALSKNPDLTPHEIIIEKNIPVGGGLGGGSSDAATIARYFNQNYNIEFTNEELAKIGADLPICYIGKSLVYSGIGEIIDYMVTLPSLYIQIINPLKPLLTKNVFATFNLEDSYKGAIDITPQYHKIDDLIQDLKRYSNDLKKAAILNLPEIENILTLLNHQKGCLYSNISGSGPSCFAIFDSLENLIDSHLQFQSQHIYYFSQIGRI